MAETVTRNRCSQFNTWYYSSSATEFSNQSNLTVSIVSNLYKN